MENKDLFKKPKSGRTDDFINGPASFLPGNINGPKASLFFGGSKDILLLVGVITILILSIIGLVTVATWLF